MQIPRLYKAGRSAHAFLWWLPVALLTAVLWIGCNKSADEEGPADGNSSTANTGQPIAVAQKEATEGGETAAGLVPNVEETSTPNALGSPVATPVVATPVAVTPVAKAAPAGPLPANAKHLPADSHMIFSINVGQMLKKGGYKELLESPIFEAMASELDDELLQAIIKDPAASGIDIDQPIHIFVKVATPAADDPFGEPAFSGGLVASVKNADAIETALNKLFASVGADVKRGKGEGYKTIMPPDGEEAPVAMGYSKDAFILVASSNPEDIAKIPGQLADRFAGKKALAKDSKAAVLLQSKYDVAAWMDYESFMNMAFAAGGGLLEEDPLTALTKDMAKDMEYTIAVRFEPGSVDVDMISYTDSELYKGLSKGGLDKSLLKLVPNNAILAGAEAFNMKPVRDIMIKQVLPLLKNGEAAEMTQEIENMLGLTIEDVLTIPKGDFLAVFDGLKLGGEVGMMPQFLLGLTIDNRANFNKLLNNPAVQGFLPSLNAFGIQIAQNENAFFICSQNHGPAVNGGQAQKPAAKRHQKLLGGDMGGYIQFDAVKALIQQLGEGEEEAQMIAQVVGKLDEATFTGTFGDDGKQGTFAKLTFKDKKANGLKQLVDLSMQIASMAGELGASFPGDLGAGVPEIEIAPAVEELPAIPVDPKPDQDKK